MRLQGQVAIITGAGTGIGAATALLFAREGAKVVVADRSEENGLEALQAIQAAGGEVTFVQTDVSDPEQVDKLFEETLSRYGRVDILVNNAGIYFQATVADTAGEQWHRLMSVNLHGAFYCSRAAVRAMRQSGGGKIVNVGSEAGLVVIPGQAAYNISKAAVIMLTKSMAVDHAPDSIRVNCVCPGTTFTPLVAEALSRADDPEAARRALESSRPLNRLGRVEEIAEAVLYLASDVSAYATGSVLSIDGGRTAI